MAIAALPNHLLPYMGFSMQNPKEPNYISESYKRYDDGRVLL
jgi:hypothetical protein